MGDGPLHVAVLDFGIKRNILNYLVSFGCRLTVFPAYTSAEEVLACAPDGIFLSNGPGDPKTCRKLLRRILKSCWASGLSSASTWDTSAAGSGQRLRHL